MIFPKPHKLQNKVLLIEPNMLTVTWMTHQFQIYT